MGLGCRGEGEEPSLEGEGRKRSREKGSREAGAAQPSPACSSSPYSRRQLVLFLQDLQ